MKTPGCLVPTVLIKQSGVLDYFDKAKPGEDDYGITEMLFSPGTATGALSLGYLKGVMRPLLSRDYKKDPTSYETLKNTDRKFIYEDDMPSAFHPGTQEININPKDKSAPVLAHELGHKEGMKKYPALTKAHRLGMVAGLLGSTGVPLLDNKEHSTNSAILGTLGFGTVLGSELDASTRGYKMLRNLGRSRLSALKSFIGVPTYLATALVPALEHKWKEHKGGFNKSEAVNTPKQLKDIFKL
jgi:hypothetical protein